MVSYMGQRGASAEAAGSQHGTQATTGLAGCCGGWGHQQENSTQQATTSTHCSNLPAPATASSTTNHQTSTRYSQLINQPPSQHPQQPLQHPFTLRKAMKEARATEAGDQQAAPVPASMASVSITTLAAVPHALILCHRPEGGAVGAKMSKSATLAGGSSFPPAAPPASMSFGSLPADSLSLSASSSLSGVVEAPPGYSRSPCGCGRERGLWILWEKGRCEAKTCMCMQEGVADEPARLKKLPMQQRRVGRS